MTKGEKSFADLCSLIALTCFWVAVAVFCLVAFVGVIGSVLHLVNNWSEGTSGMKRVFWDAFEPKQINAAIVLSLFILGWMAWEQIKAGNWRRVFMPSFIWPQESAESPTLLARLGRVLHWSFVAFAAVALLVGICVVWYNREYISGQKSALIAWDRAHQVPGQPGKVYDSAETSYGLQFRPDVPEVDNSPFWVALGAAALLALIGRGFRYIFAGE